LTWTDVANEDGYRWEVRDALGLLITSGTTGENVTAVNVGTLAPANYIARVQAFGDGVNYCDSAWTSYCAFDVFRPCEELPAPTITAIGDTTCGGSTFDTSPNLSWGDIANESGYAWELRDASNVIVRSGTTGQNVTTVNLGQLELGMYRTGVRALGDGVNYCDGNWSSNCPFEILEAGVADFVWWPMQPKQNQRVRFADRATGEPIGWFWEMDDGVTSMEQNPSHRFGSSGDFDVSMLCEYEHGSDSKIWTVTVAGVIQCGDEICEGEETAWSCPADCALDPEESGRAGGSDKRPSVPAAVGGVGGTGGTFWKTEGWVFNSGDEPLALIFEYTPLDSTEIFTAGPFDLMPDGGLYWENLVDELFGTTGNGALWLDSPQPVHFLTRSYNESTSGNFGQGVRGIRDRLTIGKNDGEVYLIGLQHDSVFRSNIFFQEVDGFWVTLEVKVYNESGELLQLTNVDIEGHSNVLRNLGSLGGGGQDSAYVTVRVIGGDARINVLGSVVDQVTGDPTTVDPIHLDQVVTKHREDGKLVDDAHHLVAVVAHTKGAQNSVWATKVIVSSPKGTADQQLTFVYIPEYDRTGVVGDRLERTATLEGGRQLVWRDVLMRLFDLPGSAKTQGSLHVYSEGAVLISSRTFNKRANGGTLGQNIKALAVGDLIDATTSGTIMGLSHVPGARTNVGIAVFSDVDTEVELRFFANFPALVPIGTITRTVEAEAHLQVPKVFEELGLSSTPLPSVHALVRVMEGGSVYVYASSVDNASGDPTTIEATRN
jgi:PKD repeat protein